MQTRGVVCFSHGSESGPWGNKIRHLAEVAARHDFAVESIDYTGTPNADERVNMLLAAPNFSAQPLVLVGSSMGGYVATVASARLQPAGLFLMAPALYLPGYLEQEPAPHAAHVMVIHGWNDAVIPFQNSLRFAQQHHAQLHLLESDHRLEDAQPMLSELFAHMLRLVRPE